MTTIKLHNTRTRKRDVFTPLDPANVRMYVCGPTVYDRAHLGNARPVVVFDVLYRLLRHVYGPDHVTYVRNFTDVDDKINARAAESGRPISEITAETTQWFLDDMGALGALTPDYMPRATEYIPQMVAMIEELVARGHAYVAEGHVLFAVESYADYGRLSGRTVEDMIAGARVEVAPYKRNPMDFVLWKPSSDDLPGWNSPWGRGRPGWHIECSAMAYELLGESFDIHGGGNDLMFPHHENEIAQSCCAHPDGEFARYWLHNEMLQVEGKKMSKSLGNFLMLNRIGVSVTDAEGHELNEIPSVLEDGMKMKVASRYAIRLFLLETHYRKPMNWTELGFRRAQSRLEKFRNAAWRGKDEEGEIDPRVIDALADDLNTPLALHYLDDLISENRFADLSASMDFLGIYQFDFNLYSDSDNLEDIKRFCVLDHRRMTEDYNSILEPFSRELESARISAKQTRDFSEVDRLKSWLIDAGVEVRMSKDGVELVPGPDFDPAKLEALK